MEMEISVKNHADSIDFSHGYLCRGRHKVAMIAELNLKIQLAIPSTQSVCGMESNMKTKLFQRDFTMVVIGQIISLFGNNILRYALPLYLLNLTGSASLYGLVMALSFIPMLLLEPVGGIIADRVNKRNVMACLDFFTSGLMLFYLVTYERFSIVLLLVVVLMLLYGIQGIYQPTVQASIPLLVSSEKLMSGNVVINMVGSLAQIVGPVLGSLVFTIYGLEKVLFISIICFFISAVMEIFIHIPYKKRASSGGILRIAADDLKEGWQFIRTGKTEIFPMALLLTAINMVFSALIVVGLPIVVNQQLGFSQNMGNQFYGYAEGILAAGGIIGALLSGTVSRKINIRHLVILIIVCTFSLLPIGLVLLFNINSIVSFIIITSSCFVMMAVSSALSIELITYVQKITPPTLTGKIMALLTCLAMCGTPLGQVIYGNLFQAFSGNVSYIFLGTVIVCLGLCVASHRIFSRLDENVLKN